MTRPGPFARCTEHPLIMIEEGMTSATRYAWFITFCPRICVAGIGIGPNTAWQYLQMRLARGGLAADRRVRLEAPAALAWQALWSKHAQ